ncbi:DUF3450 family protein [bacterium]|nr:DUF3450 family protein [bacterium]
MIHHRATPVAGACALAAAVLLVAATAAPAQTGDDPATEVAQVAEQAQDTRRQTQEQLDEWATERAELEARWESAEAQVRYLDERVQLERDRLEALTAAGDELARRLEESQRLEASLEDTLLSILRRLDRAVARDLPFLEAERTDRLRNVRRELGDPAATPADKLRRVLEALLIETGYGGALEVYQDRIAVAGEDLTCDLLYVGRLGLFWLTPDMERGGHWNPAEQRFAELDGGELDAIRRAVEMATRRRPVGVQALPLGEVGEVGGAGSATGGEASQ